MAVLSNYSSPDFFHCWERSAFTVEISRFTSWKLFFESDFCRTSLSLEASLKGFNRLLLVRGTAANSRAGSIFREPGL